MALLFHPMRTQYIWYQVFRRGIDGRGFISHPNLLPIIEVSKMSFPFCIMSPWMPGGNIDQYTKMNPDADRLTLACLHQLGNKRGQPTDCTDNSSCKCARALYTFMGWTFYMVVSLQ